MDYKAIVIGTSAGGIEALKILLEDLPETLSVPIIFVLHIGEDSEKVVNMFNNFFRVRVKEAQDKEEIKKGIVYMAPSGYHLAIEKGGIFSLSLEEKIKYSRPSIDILFESAAEVYTDELVGIILTGANSDGAAGLQKIDSLGGMCIIQDPEEAYLAVMPQKSIEAVPSGHIWQLEKINRFIKSFGGNL
ncbi:MAG: chemotaxis protein CheB [Clostridiales bacterium]|nr:chemotaxis protein CheB [Clostridiales bacterium]